MKKKASRAKSAPKKGVSPKTVDEYLAAVPQPARGTLNKVRAVIRSVVPAGTTEVISYGMPGFKHNGMVMWYAAFADHCSLFPTASIIEKFKGDLKPFRTSKGTVHFPLDTPLPTALVKRMAEARLADLAKKRR